MKTQFSKISIALFIGIAMIGNLSAQISNSSNGDIATESNKIIGNGLVSTIVEGAEPNATPKILFAPEAPEVLFEDYGTAILANGMATIPIDPILAKNIRVDASHPLKVFIQLEGDCNGVYITRKTATGFVVKELQNGTSNTPFSWHIVANRKDEVGRIANESSNYSDLRFPDAPNAIALQDNIAQDIKEYSDENSSYPKK